MEKSLRYVMCVQDVQRGVHRVHMSLRLGGKMRGREEVSTRKLGCGERLRSERKSSTLRSSLHHPVSGCGAKFFSPAILSSKHATENLTALRGESNSIFSCCFRTERGPSCSHTARVPRNQPSGQASERASEQPVVV